MDLPEQGRRQPWREEGRRCAVSLRNSPRKACLGYEQSKAEADKTVVTQPHDNVGGSKVMWRHSIVASLSTSGCNSRSG